MPASSAIRPTLRNECSMASRLCRRKRRSVDASGKSLPQNSRVLASDQEILDVGGAVGQQRARLKRRSGIRGSGRVEQISRDGARRHLNRLGGGERGGGARTIQDLRRRSRRQRQAKRCAMRTRCIECVHVSFQSPGLSDDNTETRTESFTATDLFLKKFIL